MLIKVFEDTQKRRVLFVTESHNEDITASDNNLIDSVTFMEIVLGDDGKLSLNQLNITLP